MIRTEFSGGEIAEEMEKERRLFQLQMCEVSAATGCLSHGRSRPCHVTSTVGLFPVLQYLLKVNEINVKKSVDFLQGLIKYFYAQCKYVWRQPAAQAAEQHETRLRAFLLRTTPSAVQSSSCVRNVIRSPPLFFIANFLQ